MHYLVFSVLLFFSGTIFSQNAVIDSLENEYLLSPKEDTGKVNLLNDLAFEYEKVNAKTALKYVTESEALSETLNFVKGKARALNIKGIILLHELKYDLVLSCYEEALRLYQMINNRKGITECYMSIGSLNYRQAEYKKAIDFYQKGVEGYQEINLMKNASQGLLYIGLSYQQMGNFDIAIEFCKKSLALKTDVNDQKGISSCLNSIGANYQYKCNYPLALEYFNRSLKMCYEDKDTSKISSVLINIGTIYYQLKKYDKAIEKYEEALVYKNKMEGSVAITLNNLGLAYMGKKEYAIAQTYIEDAVKIYREDNYKTYLAICLNNLGDIQLKLGKNIVAYEHFLEAKKYNLEVENQLGLCNSYLGLAKVFYNQKDYGKAKENAEKSKKISINTELVNYQRDVYELLSKIYEKTGDFKKSLYNYQNFKILSDTLFNKESIEEITQLEYEYKYKRELELANFRELTLTKTVNDTSLDLERSKRNLLWGIIVFLVILLSLGWIIFFLKLRNEKSKTQNSIIAQKLLRSQMTPHFMFNSLSVLQGMILNKGKEDSVSYLSEFSKLLRTVLESSRHQIVELSKELSAINSYMILQNLDVESPYQYNLNIDPNVNIENVKIPPMLIQPFVENAIEHAFSDGKVNKEINIKIKFEGEKLMCWISDNGIGINLMNRKNNKNKNSLATTITFERLKMLSKDLNIQGSINVVNRSVMGEQGTLVTLVIPYKIVDTE